MSVTTIELPIQQEDASRAAPQTCQYVIKEGMIPGAGTAWFQRCPALVVSGDYCPIHQGGASRILPVSPPRPARPRHTTPLLDSLLDKP